MELPQSKTAVLVTGLVIVVALVFIWLTLRPTPPMKLDRGITIDLPTGVGEALAAETIKTVHDRGNIALVTAYDHEHGSQGHDYCWEAFHSELKKHANIHIIETEVVPYDPARDGPVIGCPRVVFESLMQRHAETDALVFFINLPRALNMDSMPQHLTAKIIALAYQGPPVQAMSQKKHYADYFVHGILSALIMPRPLNEISPTAPAHPQTPREWFDKYYQVYTPQNYESLPD